MKFEQVKEKAKGVLTKGKKWASDHKKILVASGLAGITGFIYMKGRADENTAIHNEINKKLANDYMDELKARKESK